MIRIPLNIENDVTHASHDHNYEYRVESNIDVQNIKASLCLRQVNVP